MWSQFPNRVMSDRRFRSALGGIAITLSPAMHDSSRLSRRPCGARCLLPSHVLAQQRCASGRARIQTHTVSLQNSQEQDTAATEGCTAKHHGRAWQRTQLRFLSVQVFRAGTCFETHNKCLLLLARLEARHDASSHQVSVVRQRARCIGMLRLQRRGLLGH